MNDADTPETPGAEDAEPGEHLPLEPSSAIDRVKSNPPAGVTLTASGGIRNIVGAWVEAIQGDKLVSASVDRYFVAGVINAVFDALPDGLPVTVGFTHDMWCASVKDDNNPEDFDELMALCTCQELVIKFAKRNTPADEHMNDNGAPEEGKEED